MEGGFYDLYIALVVEIFEASFIYRLIISNKKLNKFLLVLASIISVNMAKNGTKVVCVTENKMFLMILLPQPSI